MQLRIFLYLICTTILIACGSSDDDSSSATSSTSNSAGASSASSENNLTGVCANDPCKVLTVGDSIIQGLETVSNGFVLNGGFRPHLFKLAKDDGHNITFVGTHRNGPDMVDGVAFPKWHSGFSGIKLATLDKMVPEPILTEFPADIVLMHVGIVDVLGTASTFSEDYQEQYAAYTSIITDIYQRNKNGLIVIYDLVHTGGYEEYGRAFGSYMLLRVINPFKEKFPNAKIELIRHPSGVGNITSSSDFHPNKFGYEALAINFYEKIRPYLD